MYVDKAIERLNNIDWSHVGKNGQEKDMELGVDFIKRMAIFCKKHNITPKLPFMTNLPSYFGSCGIGENILNKCSIEVKEIITNPSFSNAIVSFYLQACILADQNADYVECVEVYEPIITLYEQGGYFVYRERGMSFINSGLIPLTNWLEKFKE